MSRHTCELCRETRTAEGTLCDVSGHRAHVSRRVADRAVAQVEQGLSLIDEGAAAAVGGAHTSKRLGSVDLTIRDRQQEKRQGAAWGRIGQYVPHHCSYT